MIDGCKRHCMLQKARERLVVQQGSYRPVDTVCASGLPLPGEAAAAGDFRDISWVRAILGEYGFPKRGCVKEIKIYSIFTSAQIESLALGSCEGYG